MNVSLVEIHRPMTRNGHLRLPTCLEWCMIGFAGLVLATIVMPPLEMGRGEARLIQCRNNLKSIGMALHNYTGSFGTFPDLTSSSESPAASWRVVLRAWIDASPVPTDYNFDQAWDAEVNLPVARQHFLLMQCPAATPDADDLGRRYTGYAAVIGPNTLFPNGRGRRPSEVTRGLSQTIAVVEACGQQIVWTEPRDIELADETLGVNSPGPTPGLLAGLVTGFHREGAHVLFADGSVKLLSNKTSPEVLQDMLRATDD